jgi:hypothetical protein
LLVLRQWKKFLPTSNSRRLGRAGTIRDVIHYNNVAKAGSLGNPELFVKEMRAAFKSLR